MQSRLETAFGLQIGDAEWEHVRTIGDLRPLLHPVAGIQPEVQPVPVRTDEHIYYVWPWSGFAQQIRTVFLEVVIRPLVWLLAAPRVESQLPPELDQRLLIVSNHVTAYDAPLILYGLPRRMRTRVAAAMSGELLRDLREGKNFGSSFLNFVAPAGYWLITALLNVFPLPQKTAFRQSFEHAGRAMDRGYHVLVFPEGRRSADGRMQTFQTGAGLLWKDLHTAALPVYLAGLGELKKQGRGWFRSGHIVVRVGQPLQFDPSMEAAEAARLLQEAVAKLSRNPNV